MVYLLNSLYSVNQPDSWLCGGVLISTSQVLTAAACLTEVSHIYVIAGYRTYVSGIRIQNDRCTNAMKQKIVKIIIPKSYNASTWMKLDIGIGVVEKPYSFSDQSYLRLCSYIPHSISINYDVKLETLNASVLTLGWGGATAREPGAAADLNSEFLLEAHTLITNRSVCRQHFDNYDDFYFICTIGFGSNTGKDRYGNNGYVGSCDENQLSVNSTRYSPECLENLEVSVYRRAITTNNTNKANQEIKDDNKTVNVNESDVIHKVSRKQGTNVKNYGGICQNDHGGPLIGLANGQETVIGVALNSLYNYNYQCDGPYLFLSTARSSVLIKCLLSSLEESRKVCKLMNNEIEEKPVIWPAKKQNENTECLNDDCRTLVRMRPQVRLLDLDRDLVEEQLPVV